MIVLTIADLINSINLFSTVFTPCLIACAVVHLIFLLAERNLTLFVPLSPGFGPEAHIPAPPANIPLSGISSRRRRSDIPAPPAAGRCK